MGLATLIMGLDYFSKQLFIQEKKRGL